MIERIIKYMSRWFVFGNLYRPIIPFTVNLLYWKPVRGNNVGDFLSLIIYKSMLQYGGIRKGFYLKTKRLVSIGSVLSFLGGGELPFGGQD